MSTALAAPPKHFALVGSPNSGKTTLFNSLTGLRARVGNYPGVTVERREGALRVDGTDAVLLDLPGTYSLDPIGPEEQVVRDVLSGSLEDFPTPDGIVITADACAIERSLLFIAQVLRLQMPTCLVLTMVDELKARGGDLDIERLQAELGIPVIGVVGHRGRGMEQLHELLAHPERWSWPLDPPPSEPEGRGRWADGILSQVIRQRPEQSALTDRIDAVMLHPVGGTLVFTAVMVIFFQLIFAWAVPLMDLIDGGVGALASGVRAVLPAGMLADFLADGVIAGVGGVVIFVPQIALLFTLLYLLEDIGYMARAAFVVDRVMAKIGLEGRCFVSLLSSYACAVPGIMATRTIPSPRNRLVTILVAPLMTCSARLPVYGLLIAAFVPASAKIGPFGAQGMTLLGLYLVGSLSALAAAAVLKRWLPQGDALPFYMELPPYRLPTMKLLVSQVWGSVYAFLRRAGRIILAASIVLWFLFTFPQVDAPTELSESEAASYQLQQSAAGRLGHAIEPLLAPLGFDWKVGVGIVASFAAREVIVSTLAQVYAVTDEDASLREAIVNDVHPDTGEKVFTPPMVAALLMFFVFALQCMSTLAIMRRETNSWRWPAFAFGYMLVLAYGAAFAAYHTVAIFTA